MSGIALNPLVSVHRPLMLVAPNSHVKTRGFGSTCPAWTSQAWGSAPYSAFSMSGTPVYVTKISDAKKDAVE